MWVIIAILAVIMVFILYPYFRIFLKRIMLILKIKKCCENRELKLIKNGILWMLGRNSRKRCNFFIEAPDKIYAIKLIYSKRATATFSFYENGTYSVTNYFFFPGTIGAAGAGYSKNSKPKPFNNFDFSFDTIGEKSLVPVILINPLCRELLCGKGDKDKRVLSQGEEFFGASVYSLDGFIKMIA